ncbi:hypothetical protein O6H91_17G088900 [Diphasiastrum complanatum]|nr:hypothetical protein O6H91_17G088900 [Diphasiastrum complanatum]KAJ7526228.1 hypothetical protein O6H91_17G088900 [Diphasiastrum complanatum]
MCQNFVLVVSAYGKQEREDTRAAQFCRYSSKHDMRMYFLHKRALTLEGVLATLEQANTSKLESCDLHGESASWSEQKMEQSEDSAAQEVFSSSFTIRGYVLQMQERDKSIAWPFSSMAPMNRSKSIEVFLPLICASSPGMSLDVTSQQDALVTGENTSIKEKQFHADFRLHVNLGDETRCNDFDLEFGGQIKTIDGACPRTYVVETDKPINEHLTVAIESKLASAPSSDEFLREEQDLKLFQNMGKGLTFEQEHHAEMQLSVKSQTRVDSNGELLGDPKEAELLKNLESEGNSQKQQSSNLPLSVEKLNDEKFVWEKAFKFNKFCLSATKDPQNFTQREDDVRDDNLCKGRTRCSNFGDESVDILEDSIEEEALCDQEVAKNDIIQVERGALKSQMALISDQFDTIACPESISFTICDSTLDSKEIEGHNKRCSNFSFPKEITQPFKLRKLKCKAKKTRLLSDIIQCDPQIEDAAGIADLRQRSTEEPSADRSAESQVISIRSSDMENMSNHLSNHQVTSNVGAGDILHAEPYSFQVQAYSQSRNKEPATTRISHRVRSKRKCICGSMGRNKRRVFTRKSTSLRPVSQLKKVNASFAHGQGFELHLSDSSSCGDCERNISQSEQCRKYVYKIFKDYSRAEVPCLDQLKNVHMSTSIGLTSSTADDLENPVEKGRSFNILDLECGKHNQVCFEQDNNEKNMTISEISRLGVSVHGDTQDHGKQRKYMANHCGKSKEIEVLQVASGSMISSNKKLKCQESVSKHENHLPLHDSFGIHLEHYGNSATSSLGSFRSHDKRMFSTLIEAEQIDYSRKVRIIAPDKNRGRMVDDSCRTDAAPPGNEWHHSLNLPRDESCDAAETNNKRSTTIPLHDTSERQPGKLLSTGICGTNRAIIEAVETFDFSDIESTQECDIFVKASYTSKNQKGESMRRKENQQPGSTNDTENGCEKLLPHLSAVFTSRTDSNVRISIDQSQSSTVSTVPVLPIAVDNGAEATGRANPPIGSAGTQISYRRLKDVARRSSQKKTDATSTQKMSSLSPNKISQPPQTYLEKLLMNALSEQPVGDGSMRSHLMSRKGLPSGRYSFVGQTLFRQPPHKKSQHSHQVTTSTDIPCYNSFKRANLKRASSKQGSANEGGQPVGLGQKAVSACQFKYLQSKCQSFADKGTRSMVCSFPVFDSGASSDLTHEADCVQRHLSEACLNYDIIPDTAISSNNVGLIIPRTGDHISILARTSDFHFGGISSHKAQPVTREKNGRSQPNSFQKLGTLTNELSLPLRATMKGTLDPKSFVFRLPHQPPDKSTPGNPLHQSEEEIINVHSDPSCKTPSMGNTVSSQSSSLHFLNAQSLFTRNCNIAACEGVNCEPHNSFEASSEPKIISDRCGRLTKGCTQSDMQSRAFYEQKTAVSHPVLALTTSVGHTRGADFHAVQRTEMSANLLPLSQQTLPGTATSSTQSVDFWTTCIERQFDRPQSGPLFTMFKPSIIRKRKTSLPPFFKTGKDYAIHADHQTVQLCSSEASALGE